MEFIGGSLAAGIIFFIVILLIFIITAVVLEIVGQWKLLKKAGKNGWEAIIPYYNTWTLVEISGCKWWFFLIIIGSSFISLDFSYKINEATINYNPLEYIGSLINLFGMFSINYNICKKCKKDIGFAIGLTLLPFIFYPILGLGASEFNKDIKVSPYGVIKEGDK